MIYAIAKFILRFLFNIFLRLRVEGAENIPKDGPLVIASNHLSLLDPPVIGTAATRKVHFMAKQELFVPILGDLFRIVGGLPVRRGGADRAAIKHGIEILQSGQVLAIFPEGTRSKTGKLGKAEPGALMMASKAQATITPCCVIGTDYKRQGRIWPKVTVRFGKPIEFPADAVVNKEFLQQMTAELMEHIAKLQKGENI